MAPDNKKTSRFRRLQDTFRTIWGRLGGGPSGAQELPVYANLNAPFDMPAFVSEMPSGANINVGPTPRAHAPRALGYQPVALARPPAGRQPFVAAPQSRPAQAPTQPAPLPAGDAGIDFAKVPAGYWAALRASGAFDLSSLAEALPRSNASNGTYGRRHAEQYRIGIYGEVFGRWESEHIVGVAIANPGTRGHFKGPLPAYYEIMALHQAQAGSGSDNRQLDPGIHGGWTTSLNYREDNRAVLRDPDARNSNTTASNLYQLNQLGYSHILQAEKHGLISPRDVPAPRYITNPLPALPAFYTGASQDIATNSYNYMVRNDPPITYNVGAGNAGTITLGPWGQAEAHLARQAAISHTWPDAQAIKGARDEFLPTDPEKRAMALRLKGENPMPRPGPPAPTVARADIRNRPSRGGREI